MLFKILLIVYKALHGLAPKYICDLLKRKQECCYSLRSDMQSLLEVPYTRGKTLDDRAFVRAGTFLRNSLPLDIRASSSVDCFKRHLKTFLLGMRTFNLVVFFILTIFNFQLTVINNV